MVDYLSAPSTTTGLGFCRGLGTIAGFPVSCPRPAHLNMLAPAAATLDPVTMISITNLCWLLFLDPFGPVVAVDTHRLLGFTDYNGRAFIASLSPDLGYPRRFVLSGYDRCISPHVMALYIVATMTSDIMTANIAAIMMMKVTIMPWTVVIVHVYMKPDGMKWLPSIETAIGYGIIIIPRTEVPIVIISIPPHGSATQQPSAVWKHDPDTDPRVIDDINIIPVNVFV